MLKKSLFDEASMTPMETIVSQMRRTQVYMGNWPEGMAVSEWRKGAPVACNFMTLTQFENAKSLDDLWVMKKGHKPSKHDRLQFVPVFHLPRNQQEQLVSIQSLFNSPNLGQIGWSFERWEFPSKN